MEGSDDLAPRKGAFKCFWWTTRMCWVLKNDRSQQQICLVEQIFQDSNVYHTSWLASEMLSLWAENSVGLNVLLLFNTVFLFISFFVHLHNTFGKNKVKNIMNLTCLCTKYNAHTVCFLM
jgi:hypothetical protein